MALVFLLLQPILIFSQPLVDRATVFDSASQLKQQYDYVIVGGGTAGLTVANRLTEDDPSVSVLVIEYGPLDKLEPEVLVPGLPPPKEYSRNYVSVPQPGLLNKTQAVYSAAVVGGGTVINGMFFNRGSAADYDGWETLGNPGWGWSGLLPYFKKSENFTPPPPELAEYPISNDLAPHGTRGPVGSSFPQYQFPILKLFYKAWNSIGVPSNPQPNGGRAVDAFYSTLSLTAWNQSRCSAATAYYRPIADKRPNFHLVTLHSVTKIVIDKRKKRATGVQFLQRNGTETVQSVRAKQEVIIAAGAPRSPQILQLSGIGPRKLLSRLGIDVVEDLPGVGYNFQDQPAMFAGVTYDYSKYPDPSPGLYFSNQTWVDLQLKIYYENRTGPDTQAYLSGTTVAFLSLRRLTHDYEKIIASAKKTDLAKALPAGADKTLLEGYKAQQAAILTDYNSPDTAVHELAYLGGETVPLVVLKPISRGSILINSSDPLADPVFDYGTFQHPVDIQVAVAMYKNFRKFVAAEPWKAVGMKETTPGPSVEGDAAIEAAIRNFTQSTWSHPVGTCAMLPRKYGGVVDSKLRVYGLDSLSVVDASVMPTIPASHTSSTVYAVAEKAADIIKARRRKG
ncbi:MAG: hypothetical protein L6R42_002864 [Xanthoria sp. 1 TBL-2021]|nr:MAG: hypothetical protein L6R42_002864 [Xanthoria sp. 1 TBL-2021]